MSHIFATAPSPWEAQHAGLIRAAEAYQAAHAGALPDTPVWRMLEYRHDLNPVRFDHWHPNVGRMLEGYRVPTFSLSHHGWTGHMRGPTLAGLTAEPAPPVVASVPEPSSLALWVLVLCGVVAWLGKEYGP